MKKTGLTIGAFFVIVIGVFVVLLSGTSPEDANSQPVEVTLDDTFER